MLKVISNLDDSQFKGKRILVRVDFNVSVNNSYVGEDYRIRMTLPTIEYLTKRGSKVILASHLGRPKGHESHYSLAPVAKRLSEIMGKTKVRFVNHCVGQTVNKEIESMNEGDILLLENLRFHKEEESNDSFFSEQLTTLADVFVNDAFSTSHRKHASTYGAAKLFDLKLAGFNLKKEV
ncbi:MAG: phosphoglycerate kinase, partial [Nitrososphaeraceae archaeon]